MGEVTLTMAAEARETLIRAQCRSVAESLAGYADELLGYGERAELGDALAAEAVLNAIRFARADLDALTALGIGEAR